MKNLNEKELLIIDGGKFPKISKTDIVFTALDIAWKYRKQIGQALPKHRWRGAGGTY